MTKRIMDYQEALERLMSLANFERSKTFPNHRSFHLERMTELMGCLGNTHIKIPTIHVAGTKGKGSTAAIITSILSAQGLRVGLYTSPHLHRTVERIRIGLEPISQKDFACLVHNIWPIVQSVGKKGVHGEITFFEMLTAMAFVHFDNCDLDFQVIEVGLGGRLDATNVVKPEISVITNISLDHVNTLGNSLEQIAGEKAGIIKNNVPVVVGPQEPPVLEVLTDISVQRNARLIDVAYEKSWKMIRSDLKSQVVEIRGHQGKSVFELPLLGSHQIENTATAITAVENLPRHAIEGISDKIIEAGISSVKWPGRMYIKSMDGRIVVADGAHNPYSVGKLVKAISEHVTFDRVVLVFGATGEHDVGGMLAELKLFDPRVLGTQSRDPRSVVVDKISSASLALGLDFVGGYESVAESVNLALSLANSNDLIVATGSITVVAEVIENLEGIVPETYPWLVHRKYREEFKSD